MALATFSWTVMHITMKYIYSRSPQINGFDTTSFYAYFLIPFYYIVGKRSGVNFNLLALRPRVSGLLGLRMLIGVILNVSLTTGLMYIPVSKGILIFSLNPLFCAVIASIVLKEHISVISIWSTIWAFFGIYLLTVNKPEAAVIGSNAFIGYTLVLTAAWLYGLLFVVLRALNLYSINVLLSPFYLGVFTGVQTLVIFIFKRDMIHIETYDSVDWLLLCIIGIFCVVNQLAIMLAWKAAQASWMAPISYLENVFTLLADIFLFHYHFVSTDVIGMAIIVVWLLIPITVKILGNQI